MKKIFSFLNLQFLILFPLLSAFASTGESSPAPKILVSSSILADFVQQLVPAHLAVGALVGNDADPHHFEPTPADIQKYFKADLFLYFGNGFEPWIKFFEKQNLFSSKSFAVSHHIADLELRFSTHHHHGHSHGHDHARDKKHLKSSQATKELDPHFWHDPRKVVLMIQSLEKLLETRFPKDAQAIKANSEKYQKDLMQFYTENIKKIQMIPAEKKNLITTHDGFQYLEKTFDLRFFSPLGWSSNKEPSAKQIAEVIQIIKKHKIQCLFTENSISPKLLQSIAREGKVKISGELLSDSLSQTKAKTYLEMMAFNLNTILNCLNQR